MISGNLANGQSSAQREEEAVPGFVEGEAAWKEEDSTAFLPQTLGGVFDGAFDLYKRHFGTLAIIVAIVFIPTQVVLHAMGNLWLRPLTLHLNGDNFDFFEFMQAAWLALLIGVPGYGIPGFLSLLTSFMVSGPVAVAVANILLRRPVTIATAYQRALPVFWRLFWMWQLLFILFFLVLCAVSFIVFLCLAIVSAIFAMIGAPEVAVVFLFLGAILPYLVVCALGAILFSFAPPLIALENGTVYSALVRNTQLISKKLFVRTWIAVTLLPLLTFGLQILILLSAASVVEALRWPSWSGFVLNTGLASLISFFFQPYWMIFITMLYFDTRVRREGLDVRYMADNLPISTPLDSQEGFTGTPRVSPVAAFAPPFSAPAAPFKTATLQTVQPDVPPLPVPPAASGEEVA